MSHDDQRIGFLGFARQTGKTATLDLHARAWPPLAERRPTCRVRVDPITTTVTYLDKDNEPIEAASMFDYVTVRYLAGDLGHISA